MPWLDNGHGGWVWQAAEGETYVAGSVPTYPPPSAGKGAGETGIGGVRQASGPTGGSSTPVDMTTIGNHYIRPAGATPGNRGGTLAGDLNVGTADILTDIGTRQAAANGALTAVQPRSVLTANAGTTPAAPALTAANVTGTGRAPMDSASLLPGISRGAPAVKPPASPAAGSAFTQLDPGGQPGGPDDVNSLAEQGAQNSRDALGPAPTLDRDLADRGYEQFQASLGMSREVLDQLLNPASDGGLAQATTDARAVLDQLLNGPNNADRIGAQTLRAQMAMSRSAAGGPGAVQEAFRNAQNAAPELQAQATQSAVTEDLARMGAAGNVAQGLGTLATGQQANETARLSAAGNVASNFSQAALGGRQQDIGIAASNQQAATALMQEVGKLTGTQLELDQRNQELLGQMAMDASHLDFNWAQLSAEEQSKNFDRWVQVYGIDEQVAAQIKAAAAANKKGVWDYIVPIIGAAATVTAGALAGPPGAAAAGAVTGAVNSEVNS